MIFGASLLYKIKSEERKSESKSEINFENYSMTIGKDLESSNFSQKTDMTSSKTSFRISSRKSQRPKMKSLNPSNSIKKLAPIKGKKLGKIQLGMERKKPPIEHFMKKFNPGNSQVQNFQNKKLQKKFFNVPFQVHNIVINGDESKFESIKPNLKNILERWKSKIESVILIKNSFEDDFQQKLKLKKVR